MYSVKVACDSPLFTGTLALTYYRHIFSYKCFLLYSELVVCSHLKGLVYSYCSSMAAVCMPMVLINLVGCLYLSLMVGQFVDNVSMIQ